MLEPRNASACCGGVPLRYIVMLSDYELSEIGTHLDNSCAYSMYNCCNAITVVPVVFRCSSGQFQRGEDFIH